MDLLPRDPRPRSTQYVTTPLAVRGGTQSLVVAKDYRPPSAIDCSGRNTRKREVGAARPGSTLNFQLGDDPDGDVIGLHEGVSDVIILRSLSAGVD